MADRTTIVAHLDQLLDSASFSDYGPNGVQVIGSDDVTTIATSVSSTAAAFAEAAENGAEMLLVHHGLFWKSTPQAIGPVMRDRLRVLFDHDINLVAYHLPLDAHAQLGNNALICSALGLQRTDEPFAVMSGHSIGCVAVAPEPLTVSELTRRVTDAVGGRTPLVLGPSDRAITRVAICSGGAAGELQSAAAIGADAFITGEPSEDAAALAAELGIVFIAAGHYATETFGVRALGDHLAAKFSLNVVHLTADNPV